MSIRVAFAGASGTGKTTLARAVAKHLSVPMCPVGSRETAAAMGFSSPYDVDKAGKREAFQRKLIEDKRAWEAANDAFVTDRTHSDNYAYTLIHDPAAVLRLLEMYERANLVYTHVFFCPIGSHFDPGDDPQRRAGFDYHSKFESELMLALPASLSPAAKLIVVHPSEREDRIALVLRTLGDAR